jgi:hypothetical protein
MYTLPIAGQAIPVAPASSAMRAISTACGNVNSSGSRVVIGDRARVKEVKNRVQVSWHCYRRPVLEGVGKPIGDRESEFALAARAGSGSLRSPVRRCPTGATEYGVNSLGRKRIWHIQSDIGERGCYQALITHCDGRLKRGVTVEDLCHLRIVISGPRRLNRSLTEVAVTVTQHRDACAQLIAACSEKLNRPRSHPGSHRHDAQRVDEGLLVIIISSPGPAELPHNSGVRDTLDKRKALSEQRGGPACIHVQPRHAQNGLSVADRQRGYRSRDSEAVRELTHDDELIRPTRSDDICCVARHQNLDLRTHSHHTPQIPHK